MKKLDDARLVGMIGILFVVVTIVMFCYAMCNYSSSPNSIHRVEVGEQVGH